MGSGGPEKRMHTQRRQSVFASLRRSVAAILKALKNVPAHLRSLFTENFPLRNSMLRPHAGLQPIPVKTKSSHNGRRI